MNARKLSLLTALALLVAMALPLTTMAKGKHKGRRGGRHFDQYSRKCEKFVNCHDASEGRWDGRGPNRERFDDRFNGSRRFRNRDFDDTDFRRMQRRRIRDYRYRDSLRDYRYDQYNPYRSQSGSNWTDLLNMFLR